MLNSRFFTKVALVAMAVAVAEQSHAADRMMSMSIKGGVNLTKQTNMGPTGGNLDYSQAFGLGYMGGIGADFGGTLGFSIDVFYALRAMKATYAVIGDTTVKATQIFIPVMARYRAGIIQIGLGGYYAMGIGKLKTSYGGGSTSQSYTEAGASKSDYGVTGGLGVVIPSGSMSWVLEGRYNFGLANLIKDPVGDSSIKNQSVDFLAGVMF